jgi:hypothetical protein
MPSMDVETMPIVGKVMLIGPPGVGKTRAVAELKNPNETDPRVKIRYPDSGLENICPLKLLENGTMVPSTINWRYFSTPVFHIDEIVLSSDGVPTQFNLWDVSGKKDARHCSQNVSFFIVFAPEEDEARYIEQCGTTPYRIIRRRCELRDALTQ